MVLQRFFAKVSTQNDVPDSSGSLSASISPAKIKETDDAAIVSTTTLHMREIFHSKHMQLKTTKIYSKGVLVKHTKISTTKISNYTVTM